MTGQYLSPFGWLTYRIEKEALLQVSWVIQEPEERKKESLLDDFWDKWFVNPSIKCPLPLALYGTVFQRAVWSQLIQIPMGQTRTYKQIAVDVGSPNAQQAVGQACKANPIALLIPCHRVIGKNDRLTGYVGKTLLSKKSHLLEWERVVGSMQ